MPLVVGVYRKDGVGRLVLLYNALELTELTELFTADGGGDLAPDVAEYHKAVLRVVGHALYKVRRALGIVADYYHLAQVELLFPQQADKADGYLPLEHEYRGADKQGYKRPREEKFAPVTARGYREHDREGAVEYEIRTEYACRRRRHIGPCRDGIDSRPLIDKRGEEKKCEYHNHRNRVIDFYDRVVYHAHKHIGYPCREKIQEHVRICFNHFQPTFSVVIHVFCVLSTGVPRQDFLRAPVPGVARKLYNDTIIPYFGYFVNTARRTPRGGGGAFARLPVGMAGKKIFSPGG